MDNAVFEGDAHLQYTQRTAFNLKAEPKLKMENLPLEFDTRHPEHNMEDISQTKNIIESTRILTMNSQMPLESHATKKLSSLQTKLYKNELKLRHRRNQLNDARKTVQQDWEDLEKKEHEFKENFISFNTFVETNYAKRKRAQKQIADDKAMFRKREQQTKDLIEKIKETRTLVSWINKNIKNLKPCSVFMERVVEEYEEFTTINDVMDRYIDLDEKNNFLSIKHNADMAYLERFKNDLMKLIEEKTFVIMGLNNQIANLQARYEHANIKALESEGLVTQIKNNAVKQLEEIDTVKNSIWNVYVHMATSKKHPIKIKKDNVEEQMMHINRTLTELSKVNKLIKKKATKVK